MPNFVAVSSAIHSKISVREDMSYAHAKSQHIVPLVVHEFSHAAQEYPIIFVKDNDANKFRAVALLGLKPSENLFFNENGWKAQYIPESIQGYPFIIAPDSNNKDKHILVIDEECNRLCTEPDASAQTKSLFDENGKQTEFIQNVGKFLTDHLGKQIQTNAFVEKLHELKIIEKQTLEVSVSGQGKFNIDGMYIINEKTLNELPDKDFKELRKLGYIGAIYASLLSMNRIGSLVRMADKKNIEKSE